MANKVIVPDIGDFEEVEIIEILVKSGDKVKKNDSIVTLESDKSSVEVPSTHSGKIEKIKGQFFNPIFRAIFGCSSPKTPITLNLPNRITADLLG